jgi:hypothetical protein
MDDHEQKQSEDQDEDEAEATVLSAREAMSLITQDTSVQEGASSERQDTSSSST